MGDQEILKLVMMHMSKSYHDGEIEMFHPTDEKQRAESFSQNVVSNEPLVNSKNSRTRKYSSIKRQTNTGKRESKTDTIEL